MQIAMAVFSIEGGYLNRAIASIEIAALELEAKLMDFRSVGIDNTIDGARLITLVRENRPLLNYARRRVLG
jgi:hypothetical protein